jgi:hypothetical protein
VGGSRRVEPVAVGVDLTVDLAVPERLPIELT